MFDSLLGPCNYRPQTWRGLFYSARAQSLTKPLPAYLLGARTWAHTVRSFVSRLTLPALHVTRILLGAPIYYC